MAAAGMAAAADMAAAVVDMDTAKR